MSKDPFLVASASGRPLAARASGERLSSVLRLGYNIAPKGGRTGLITNFLTAFGREASGPLPLDFAGASGEEDA